MRLRNIALLLVAFIALSCSRTSDVVEIEFWNFGGMPKFLEWVRKEVQVYNSTHPKVKVVLAEKSWHQIREILYAGFSAGAGLRVPYTAAFDKLCQEALQYKTLSQLVARHLRHKMVPPQTVHALRGVPRLLS